MKNATYAILFALALISCNYCQAGESSDLTTGPAMDQSLFIDMDDADLSKGGFYVEEEQADSDDAGLAKCYFWCHRAPAVYFYRPRYYYYRWFSPVYRTSFRIIMYSVPARRIVRVVPEVVTPEVAAPEVAAPVTAAPVTAAPVTAAPVTAVQGTAAVQGNIPQRPVSSNSILTSNQQTSEEAPAMAQTAVQAPAQEPAEVASETPEQAPEQKPAEVANETPAEATDQDLVEVANETPAEATDQDLVEVANETPAEATDQDLVEVTSETPTQAPDANASPSARAPLYEANAPAPAASQTEENNNDEIEERISANERVRNALDNSDQYALARHSSIAKSSGRAARGAVIDRPIPAGTPLANLGLRTGDILTHIDGRPINSIYDLRQAKANSKVTFVRGNEILVSNRPMLQTATNEVAKSFDGSNEEDLNMRMVKGMQHKTLNLYEYYDIQAKMEANAAAQNR